MEEKAQVKYYPIPYSPYDHVLYAHVNKVNNKVYFGITKKRPLERWSNGRGYKNCSKFNNAIKKYGWSNFYHIIIRRYLTYEEAIYYEQYFICKFESYEDDKGYNTSKGGRYSKYYYEQKRADIKKGRIKPIVCLETEEVYDSLSEIGRILNIDAGYIGYICRNSLNGYYTFHGKHYMYLDEYKNKSNIELKRIIKETKRNFNPVVCIEDGKEYFNASKAAIDKGSYIGRIYECCKLYQKGIISTANGFHWVFKKDFINMKHKDIERVINSGPLKVYCVELDRIFNSSTDAERALGVPSHSIVNCCDGKTRRAHGYKWYYYCEYIKRKHKLLRSENRNCKHVVMLENGAIYKSSKEASEKTHYNKESIRKACYTKSHRCLDSHWMYLEDYELINPEKIQEIIKAPKKHNMIGKTPVICLETSKVYKDAHEALKDYPTTSIGSITSCCKRNDPNRLTAGKVHWMYLKEYKESSVDFIKSILSTKKGLKLSKSVTNIDTMTSYPSISQASIETGVSPKTIRRSCLGLNKGRSGHKSWRYTIDI